jgi:hypothetical protein
MNISTKLLLLPLVCLVLLAACSSRTVTGGYEDSPDGKFRLWIRKFGAYGRAFVDRTEKVVHVRLVEILGDKNNWNEKLLFEKDYHFTCADVGLQTSWDANHNLTAVVYDWPDGVVESDAEKQGIKSNYIATLSFEFDNKTGKFMERR